MTEIQQVTLHRALWSIQEATDELQETCEIMTRLAADGVPIEDLNYQVPSPYLFGKVNSEYAIYTDGPFKSILASVKEG